MKYATSYTQLLSDCKMRQTQLIMSSLAQNSSGGGGSSMGVNRFMIYFSLSIQNTLYNNKNNRNKFWTSYQHNFIVIIAKYVDNMILWTVQCLYNKQTTLM